MGTKAGVTCGKIEGADPPTLAKRVQDLANEPVTGESKAEGVDGVQPEMQAKLKKLIRCGEDQPSVRVFVGCREDERGADDSKCFPFTCRKKFSRTIIYGDRTNCAVDRRSARASRTLES